MDATPLCDGRFVPYRRLGAGSQAETFEGVDRANGRVVAIKRFDVHGATSWKEVELAEREASVLSTLSHPALPAYVHHFEHDGALFLVMEKVEGLDLAKRLDAGQRFSFDELLTLLEALADVLEYLHWRSPPLVHRDIKPSNIVQRPDGGYSLIDFGSVRDGLRPTGGSTVVGTFGFMAPEQFQGRALPASDLYGTGATLLTLLTGASPDKLPHRGLEIDVRAALPTTTPPAWLDLLERLLCADPDKRALDLKQLLPALRAPNPANVSGSSHFPRNHVAPNGGKSPPNAGTHLPGGPQNAHTEWLVGAGTMLPIVFLVLLSLLRAFLFLVMQVALPTLLMALSVVFGKSLRRTAADVTRAGCDVNRHLLIAIERVARASPVVVGRRQRMGPMGHFGHERGPHVRSRPTWRVEPAKPPRMRIGNFDVELPPNSPNADADATRRNRR